jgi:hypothetical protein
VREIDFISDEQAFAGGEFGEIFTVLRGEWFGRVEHVQD